MIVKYLDILLKELEDLDTIFKANLYSGELHIDDISKMNIKMSQNRDKCTVFVDYEGGSFEDNPAKPNKNFIEPTFTIYIVGYCDKRKDSTAFSSACIKCAEEINRLVKHREFHRLSGAEAGYTKPLQTRPLANGIKSKNAHMSIHVYAYSQRMTFDYE